MTNIYEIREQIVKLKQLLNELIEQKGTLMDPKIIEISQRLDDLLEDYDYIINNKPDK